MKQELAVEKRKKKELKRLVSLIAEAVVHRCSVKNLFLEISQNSQENTRARVSFLIKLKLQAFGLQLY